MEAQTARPAETKEVHTRMLRIGLASEESRAWWRQADRPFHPDEQIEVAFQERWFGSRSLARVRYLCQTLAQRFDAFPAALRALHTWDPPDPADRRLVCHWHVQLSDPLYREFSGGLLEQRRLHPKPTIDRDETVRWLDRQVETRWGPATAQRMASALVTCVTEAGLCRGRQASRPLVAPRVSDDALSYLLHLLREVAFDGTLRDNPYLASVGLAGELLEPRLRQLPGLGYRRRGKVEEFDWAHAGLEEWAAS